MSVSDKLPLPDKLLEQLKGNVTYSIEVYETPQGIVISKTGKPAGAMIAAGSLLFAIAEASGMPIEGAAESAIGFYQYVIKDREVVL